MLFLHGAGGLFWDPFLDAVAAGHPGASRPSILAPATPRASSTVEDLWDLVLYYNELLDHFELPRVSLLGHSFGGMVAAEIVAPNPRALDKLALIAPIGLWLDEHPVPDISGAPAGSDPRPRARRPGQGPLAALMPAPDPSNPESLFRAGDDHGEHPAVHLAVCRTRDWANGSTG